jgi:hypothetical protein
MLPSWMFLQSRQFSDIVAHFTPDETSRWRALMTVRGARMGGVIGVLAVVINQSTRGILGVKEFVPSLLLGVGLAVLLAPLLGLTYAYGVRQETRDFLCSTDYARACGYRADSLPLFRLGF